MFESNGLLDFGEPDTDASSSQTLTSGANSKPSNLDAQMEFDQEDDDMFASLPAYDNLPAPSSKQLPEPSPRYMDGFSPPPDLQEEPEDWEAELEAMQEAEAEENLARSRMALRDLSSEQNSTTISRVGYGHGSQMSSMPSRKGKEKAVPSNMGVEVVEGFGDSDIFDDDVNKALAEIGMFSRSSFGARYGIIRSYHSRDQKQRCAYWTRTKVSLTPSTSRNRQWTDHLHQTEVQTYSSSTSSEFLR